MDVKEYDEIVRFLESKDSEQRNWPRDVLESKDVKDANRAGLSTEMACFSRQKGGRKG